MYGRIHEDVSTRLTPPSQKRTVFRGALKYDLSKLIRCSLNANLDQAQNLIQALTNPSVYPHPVTQITIQETHISWVLLTGPFAYKIKKPVNLGFVDFSTLALRHHACLEELRLNGRLAPTLYLEVVSTQGYTASTKF